MSLGTFLSRILGFIRDISFSAVFSKTETDIFFSAFRFPNFFRRLLGEGSFSASVTPILTQSLSEKGKKYTKELNSCFFTLLFCLAILLTLLGVFFMEEMMNLFFGNSAYASIEGKLEKTVLVARLVFTYLFFVSLYSYFMSVAQVFGKFFIPALAPAFFNISLIAFAWTPKAWWPFPALSLAWAVVAGGILQLLPVLYEMWRLGLTAKLTFRFNYPAVFQLGRRFLPGMFGLAGLSLIGLINIYFSADLEEGSISYIYYGDRLMEFPRALIAVSLGTALIPELTRQSSSESRTEFKAVMSYYLRLLLFLTLPCAVVFLSASETLVHFLFGRGEFDAISISQTAMVLQTYSLVLIFSSMSRILSSGFFALNKNWYMAFGTLLFVCFHFLCAGFLTPLYGLKGLVGATALSSAFYFFLLTFFLSYLIGLFDLKPLLALLLKTLPGLILLGLCLVFIPILWFILAFYLSFIVSHSVAEVLSSFIALILAFGLGGAFYILGALLFKEPMANEFLNFVKKLILKRGLD